MKKLIKDLVIAFILCYFGTWSIGKAINLVLRDVNSDIT